MERFPGYDVDCEYNRDHDNPKEIPDLRERLVAGHAVEEWPEDTEARTVYPDIIVHRRGQNWANLLVIEVKKGFWPNELDEAKLAGYLMSYSLRYEYAAAVQLGVGQDAGRVSLQIAHRDDLDRLRATGQLFGPNEW